MDQTRKFAELSGGTLDDVFERSPFLGEYFNEMRRHMPEEITWEAAMQSTLRLGPDEYKFGPYPTPSVALPGIYKFS